MGQDNHQILWPQVAHARDLEGAEGRQGCAPEPGHEWWLRNGERVRTEDLKPGMSVVKSARGKGLPTLSPAGIQAGFIFGDGTDSIQGARAGFYGDKDQAMLPWFSVEAAEASYPYADARGDLRRRRHLPPVMEAVAAQPG